MLPILLNLDNRLVLVVGGGEVGLRKARTALEAGGRVRLVCLEPASLAHPRLEWRQEAYRAEHLEGVVLALAAGPPEVNERVARDAEARGLLVSVASEPERGSVILPSTLRRGRLLVSVSTSGTSPILACRIRDRIGADLDKVYADWLDLLAELRPVVKKEIADAGLRRRVMGELSEWYWLDRLRTRAMEEVREEMLAVIRRGG